MVKLNHSKHFGGRGLVWSISKSKTAFYFFSKIFRKHRSIWWGQLFSCFGLLLTDCPLFQSKGGPLACMAHHLHDFWILQIHLWCVTPADFLMASMTVKLFWSMYLHTCVQALVRLRIQCMEQCADTLPNKPCWLG